MRAIREHANRETGRKITAAELDSSISKDFAGEGLILTGESLRGESPGTEQYEPIVENEFLSPYDDPLSIFSIDVDTASYANVRRFLKQYQWPSVAAVRIEKLVNYFRYDYAEPTDGPLSSAWRSALAVGTAIIGCSASG